MLRMSSGVQWRKIFFDMSRGKTSYDVYQAMFDLAWMDVTEQSGLDMNDVGQAFLRGAGLTARQLFDLRLRVDEAL